MRNILSSILKIKHSRLLIILSMVSLAFATCKTSESGEDNKPETDTDSVAVGNTENPRSEIQESEDIRPDTLAYCLKDGVGAGGFDLVSYFNSTQPQRGSNDISSKYNGIIYLFQNVENKNIFDQNPEKYLPAYGGWCAMTLSMGRATTPVYDNFLMVNGKLHLFERTVSVNGRTLWQQDPDLNAQRATKNYNDYKDDGIISGNE